VLLLLLLLAVVVGVVGVGAPWGVCLLFSRGGLGCVCVCVYVLTMVSCCGLEDWMVHCTARLAALAAERLQRWAGVGLAGRPGVGEGHVTLWRAGGHLGSPTHAGACWG
jgi:hypothetical protein